VQQTVQRIKRSGSASPPSSFCEGSPNLGSADRPPCHATPRHATRRAWRGRCAGGHAQAHAPIRPLCCERRAASFGATVGDGRRAGRAHASPRPRTPHHPSPPLLRW
jgi:hypothetical protein